MSSGEDINKLVLLYEDCTGKFIANGPTQDVDYVKLGRTENRATHCNMQHDRHSQLSMENAVNSSSRDKLS